MGSDEFGASDGDGQPGIAPLLGDEEGGGGDAILLRRIDDDEDIVEGGGGMVGDEILRPRSDGGLLMRGVTFAIHLGVEGGELLLVGGETFTERTEDKAIGQVFEHCDIYSLKMIFSDLF